jgi:predicted Zn-ribbon and HTH transcriptional regulator
MKQKLQKPTVPRPARETVRHAVIDLLHDQTLSAKEISAQAHISEKEVYSHLEHIRLSIQSGGGFLEVTPAECRSCGFVFVKRDRLTPPGKCPVCLHETIFEPLFTIRSHQKLSTEKEDTS